MKLDFIISKEEDGSTLAAVVRSHAGDIPWSRARGLCERSKVRVGSEVANDPARRVHRGEKIEIDEHAKTPKLALARLVFEDSQVVVINKPPGVSSVPYEKRETGTAMDLIRDAWRDDGRKGSDTPLHVVHRIDKDTSGLLLFAKTKPAERALQTLFRAHDIERTYLCVVHGKLTDRRIESRLVQDRGDGLRGSSRKLNLGKRAVTHVKTVEELHDATLCEVKLETGKTHQIRIHLSENGHPLVGERVYIRDFVKNEHTPIESPRLLLHAATLGFAHPVSGEVLRFSAPLPDDFERELAKLRRKK